MDSCSTTGLFDAPRRISVSEPVWISFAASVLSLLTVRSQLQVGGFLVGTFRSLWILPLSVLTASICVLIANAERGHGQTARIPMRFLSGAYLTCGPSLALLDLSNSFGIPSPVWVELITPVLLPVAAWAYYQSLESPEESGIDLPKGPEDF